ncbi:MAG: DUF2171 domain-containing protein [Acetobacteraceae bacterium]|nr:DUF2171 domain-containing protein [Acetobacteraceae bacterium]
MSDGPEIKEHMDVVGSDGQHVGTVDKLERGRIKLTRGDDPDHTGGHRAIPLGAVDSVEGGQVRLTLTGMQARALAAGGADPAEVVEDGTAPVGGDEGAAERAASVGAGVPDDGGARGGPRGGVGSAGGMDAGGTGGGGTSSHGYLGGGGGIVDDPNMDPDGGERP